MSTVVAIRKSFPTRIRTGCNDALFLLRSPRRLLLGLKRKWLVPCLLLLSLLLIPLAVLPVTDRALEKIYPPTTKDKLVRLFKSTHQNPVLASRKSQAAFLLWFMGGAGVMFGLILYAPVIRQAGEDDSAPITNTSDGSDNGQQLAVPGDRYRIEAEIGAGTMGVVYAGFDRTLERAVALKELPAASLRDKELRERFRREALTLARLTHPGIVHIYDLLDDSRRMILVMELVRGGTLERVIAEQAPFAEHDAAAMVLAIADTLEHVHKKGIIHRDLKPANILIDEHQNLKVTDFGLARLMQDSELTIDGSVFGSPRYMSPEQAGGNAADFRSDIYSLGIIFYELLTGEPPFTGEPMVVMAKQVNEEPEPPSARADGISGPVDELVMAMLSKDPAGRLADLGALRDGLRTT